ncbi:MAG: hypothetical protein JXO22_08395, partial [Phycisphaerae bacterium]|nr:hypothetical protein [Phycisphaerae bacterium]
MKKVLVIAMVLAMAGVAYADRTVFSEGNGVTMTAIPLDGAAGTPRGLVDYSNMDLTSPSWDVSATAVVVDEDDYQCATLTGTQMLESFRFVGGVENASEILWFNFYDSAHNYV